MSSQGSLEYVIRYTPENYAVQPVPTFIAGQQVTYYAIISKSTGNTVAFAFDENMARTVCLSLELIRAQVYGERSKVTQLMKLIDKLSSNTGGFERSKS